MKSAIFNFSWIYIIYLLNRNFLVLEQMQNSYAQIQKKIDYHINKTEKDKY